MTNHNRTNSVIGPSEQRLHRLDLTFADAVEVLHDRLEALVACEPFTFRERAARLPTSVVYLFSEGGAPLYVGRSNKFRQRLGNHCQVSARANQSALAFKLARESAGITQASYSGENTRAKLMANPVFLAGFNDAKRRLGEMQIRYVAEPNQVQQALLEIYCAVALRTPYNAFGTH
jgi:hypothetical protein